MKKSMITQGCTLALGLTLGVGSAFSQAAPTETKVKRVLMYNKVGGWVHTDGLRDVHAVLKKMAVAKGFIYDSLKTESGLTLENLKKYQVIIWNNNVNGAGSVNNDAARKAVMDYVNQGGGWLLIHGAGDHGDTWKELRDVVGTKFTTHGNQGQADATVDPAAKADAELKYVVQGIPDKFRLHDEWYSFENTVRKVPNTTVLYTAGNGASGVLKPMADNSNDYTYVWARKIGEGKAIYNAIGHGGNELMSQADSTVPKLYWNCMRYLAGDFAAGVNVKSGLTQKDFSVSKGGNSIRVNFTQPGDAQVVVRDLRGSVVWKQTINSASNEITLGSSVRPGVYQVEARNGGQVTRNRVVLQ